jgi:hypothetical protein
MTTFDCQRASLRSSEKIQRRKQKIGNSRDDPLQFDTKHSDLYMLTDLRPPSADEMLRLIRSMPAKSSPIDAFPTAVIKNCANIFSVLNAQLVSLSFKEGKFPNKYKRASVKPLLKNEGLDSDVL